MELLIVFFIGLCFGFLLAFTALAVMMTFDH